MANYLIFGGSGFIGWHLANYIADHLKGNAVIFDIENARNSDIEFERIDVRNSICSNYSPNGESVIFNLAAVHRTPGHPSNEYFETNLQGAENVCNYAREHKINTIVFTSSIAVYGTYEQQKNENTIPMPDIPYGISKLTAEYIHRLWQLEDPEQRKLIIVRPGVVFGEHENGNFTRLINSISKGRFFYPGRKDTIKACIYVKDLVETMMNMLSNEKSGIHLYNMTYDPPPSIEEICGVIGETAKVKKPKVKLPATILLMVSRAVYTITQNENFHPDRVKKLMVSNNISGTRLNDEYSMKYGLLGGIVNWMKETGFDQRKKEIH
ncbi:NAD-dependent epimerase/dehydratase family protein [Flagellimonas sp.]|uniref:NAD-dependent epimerase/dehydratase family protein n=1 Tax=Flagellimonas sp. TaxID=2058762 RepID=UPI003BB1FA26